MKIKWNEYTWYSKLAAAIFFIILLPIWTFYVGTQYEKTVQLKKQIPAESSVTVSPEVISYKMIEATTTNGIFTFPRITHFSDQSVANSVNIQLDKIQKSLSCTAGDSYSIDDLHQQLTFVNKYSSTKYTDVEIQNMNQEQTLKALGWDYNVAATVSNTSKNIFSVTIKTDFNCGGAHPGNDDNSVTFDMRTGKVVELQDLISDFKTNKQALAKIVFPIDSKWQGADSNSSECDINATNSIAQEDFEYSSFYISKEKLFIVPSLPHVIHACGNDVEVPLSKISSFINQNSILARLSK